MHTAMMQYKFFPQRLEEACSIWRREVLEVARGHEGFVRMQLYSRSNSEALAIGTWESRETWRCYDHRSCAATPWSARPCPGAAERSTPLRRGRGKRGDRSFGKKAAQG